MADKSSSIDRFLLSNVERSWIANVRSILSPFVTTSFLEENSEVDISVVSVVSGVEVSVVTSVEGLVVSDVDVVVTSLPRMRSWLKRISSLSKELHSSFALVAEFLMIF